jgi:predicted transcriptional regulator of viral defense system
MIASGIAAIYKSTSTVFTPQELAALWGITSAGYLRARIQYYIKKGYLSRIYQGIYAKNKNDFNVLEAANKLRAPSYVSLETVLAKEGIIFQKYSSVFLISYASKTVTTPIGEFVYKKIKDTVLFDRRGVVSAVTYLSASKERAFLDAVYLYKDYHFDNLKSLDWDKVSELAKIYRTAALEKRIRI